MSKKEKVNYRGMENAPRDFLASLLPDPAKIGPLMHGKTCAGAHVKGLDKEGSHTPVTSITLSITSGRWITTGIKPLYGKPH